METITPPVSPSEEEEETNICTCTCTATSTTSTNELEYPQFDELFADSYELIAQEENAKNIACDSEDIEKLSESLADLFSGEDLQALELGNLLDIYLPNSLITDCTADFLDICKTDNVSYHLHCIVFSIAYQVTQSTKNECVLLVT